MPCLIVRRVGNSWPCIHTAASTQTVTTPSNYFLHNVTIASCASLDFEIPFCEYATATNRGTGVVTNWIDRNMGGTKRIERRSRIGLSELEQMWAVVIDDWIATTKQAESSVKLSPTKFISADFQVQPPPRKQDINGESGGSREVCRIA